MKSDTRLGTKLFFTSKATSFSSRPLRFSTAEAKLQLPRSSSVRSTNLRSMKITEHHMKII